MRSVLFFAIASVGIVLSAYADVSVTIATPRGDAGGVHFDLLVLNDDATRSDEHAVPPTLDVSVSTATGTFDTVAKREDKTADVQTVALRAGGFVRVAYVIEHAVDDPAPTVKLKVPPATNVAPIAADAPQSPIDALVRPDPVYRSEIGLVEFLSNRIKPHEPVYIIAGDEEITTKFQFSFKYQILNPEGPIAKKAPPLAGIYFAYSQTSLWDLGDDSNPFYDSVYRPEMLVSYENLERFFVNGSGERLLPDWFSLAAQAGYRHESNGRDGDDSRSLNYLYVRPIFTFKGKDDWFLTIAPTFFSYVGDLSDNPDIYDYRGHSELRAVMGQGGGVQLAVTGRVGDTDANKGSLEFDLSVPIRKITAGNFDVYFHTQYFMGYGETLLTYDEPTYGLRFGIALVR
jgi:outer membrane phospholipase A